ncbi:MAG: hypothetical protein GY832_39935 [Chloroflexi bacterium]|nr:hypothetical protein [Chloroflexota bacterium]
MQDAMVDDQLVQAGPDSPEQAQCPACGAAVVKRKRRRMVTIPGFIAMLKGRKNQIVHAGTAPSARIADNRAQNLM